MRFVRLPSIPSAPFSVLASVLFALSCGGGGSSPASPTVVATPTPAASASPDSGAGASTYSCPLGMGDVDAACSKSSPQLAAAIDAAIDRLVRERPSLFDLGEEQGAGTAQYRVLDAEAYLDGLVTSLRAAGLCAERTLDRERLVAKSSNAFSEEWDVLSAQGFVRRASGASYKQSCQPASFPVAPADLVSFVFVGFFAIECNAPTVAPDMSLKTLPVTCDGWITATPKLKNGRDVPSWVHGDEVTWFVRDGETLVSVDEDYKYGNAFNRVLRPQGGVGNFSVCATVLGKQGCVNAKTVN